MAKKGFKISKEIKEETLERIKNKGISVAQAAQDIGVSTVTIYSLEGTPKFRHLFYVLSSYLRVYSSANFKGAIPNALCILERL